MRILFAADVVPDPDSGAAGTEWQTIRALRSLGHEVDEIWADDMRRRIAHGNLHYLLELPREYARAIDERCASREYDVIHVNQSHCLRAARRHLRLRRRAAFILRSHGLEDRAELVRDRWHAALGLDDRKWSKRAASRAMDLLMRRRDRAAYAAVDGIIVSASTDRDFLVEERAVPASRVALIPQAPADVFVSSPAPAMTAERSMKLLHVGGFAWFKGVDAIAGALNRLAPVETPWSMTWVCRAEDHERARHMLSAPARSRVQFADWRSQSELRDLYDTHGVFLFPSLFEGFGKAFLEAMARGMVVIGTATGGMRDILRDGENGVQVPFNDPGAIASRAATIMDDRQLANRLGSAAAQTARLFSWRRTASEIAEFYARVLAEREVTPNG